MRPWGFSIQMMMMSSECSTSSLSHLCRCFMIDTPRMATAVCQLCQNTSNLVPASCVKLHMSVLKKLSIRYHCHPIVITARCDCSFQISLIYSSQDLYNECTCAYIFSEEHIDLSIENYERTDIITVILIYIISAARLPRRFRTIPMSTSKG